VVNVVVDFPTRLSPKEKELLERLRDVSGNLRSFLNHIAQKHVEQET
jgi:DnaJ-class molecular chaperone